MLTAYGLQQAWTNISNDKQSVIEVMALKPEGYLLKTMPPADIIAAVDDFFAKRKFKMQ